jgi:hypothetical protein
VPFGIESIATPAIQQRPAPVYTYLIADLRTGVIIDEVPLTSVRFGKRLNNSGSLSAALPLAGLAPSQDVYNLTTPCKNVVYVLRDDRPVWGGVIWTREYDSEQQAVSIGCGDFWTYFDHRKVVPFLATFAGNVEYVAKQSINAIAEDQNEIARYICQRAEAHTGGDIGITYDESLSGILRDRTYWGYELTSVGDALRNLCNVIDGPDMMFDVAGTGSGAIERRLLIGTPHLGQQGSPHVWEYGGNLVGYRWPSDGSSMATRTYAIGDGIEQAALIAFSEDFDRYADGWPLLEAEAGYSTVIEADTLNGHAQADQQAARLPVALPVIRVRGDRSPYLGEYSVGDDARVVIEDGFLSLDTTMRIVAMDVSVDATEDVALTMAPVLEDAY